MLNCRLIGLMSLYMLLSPFALAQSSDVARGAELAKTCAACHGEAGNAADPSIPKIAGLAPKYFIKQLQDYQAGPAGCRENPMMQNIVSTLSAQDILDLSAFYATQSMSSGSAQPDLVRRGEQLYRAGDRIRQITACIACHGPQGKGNALANFPYVAGQHSVYIAAQLSVFRDKQRCNDQNHIMRDIAGRMSLDDMQAVASYIEGLY